MVPRYTPRLIRKTFGNPRRYIPAHHVDTAITIEYCRAMHQITKTTRTCFAVLSGELRRTMTYVSVSSVLSCTAMFTRHLILISLIRSN